MLRRSPRLTGSGRDSLALRAASAAVLIPLVLGTAYLGGPAFAALAGGAGLLAWREWRRLFGRPAWDAAGFAGVAGVAAACAAFQALGAPAAAIAAGVAALAVAAAERGPPRRRAIGMAGIGLATLLIVATLSLRSDDGAGRATIFWLFAVVWASDSGAYAAGRLLRGPRLVPRVSPGKTWAGGIGGVAAAVGASLLLGWLLPLAGWVAERPPSVPLAVAGAACSLAGQLGDLAESALKRRVGAGDSGRLIPGHGGILDRIDAYAAAAFVLILATHAGAARPPWSYAF